MVQIYVVVAPEIDPVLEPVGLLQASGLPVLPTKLHVTPAAVLRSVGAVAATPTTVAVKVRVGEFPPVLLPAKVIVGVAFAMVLVITGVESALAV